MRIAILSESSADEAALRILVNAVLGVQTTSVAYNLQGRGYSQVRSSFEAIAKTLHYRSEAEGLVVVVDSNHTYLSGDDTKNRLRDFQEVIERCRKQFKPVANRSSSLKIAVGVAASAIEAWWLCKTHPHISESAWEKGLNEKREPYTKSQLKNMLYEREFRSLEWMTQRMTEAAHDATKDVSTLEKNFPNGFGSLVKELRSWRRIN